MTQPLPTELLEARAAEQRRQLHNAVYELRCAVKERLDIKRNAREYFLPAAGVLGLVGLAIGYSVTGIFTRH